MIRSSRPVAFQSPAATLPSERGVRVEPTVLAPPTIQIQATRLTAIAIVIGATAASAARALFASGPNTSDSATKAAWNSTPQIPYLIMSNPAGLIGVMA